MLAKYQAYLKKTSPYLGKSAIGKSDSRIQGTNFGIISTEEIMEFLSCHKSQFLRKIFVKTTVFKQLINLNRKMQNQCCCEHNFAEIMHFSVKLISQLKTVVFTKILHFLEILSLFRKSIKIILCFFYRKYQKYTYSFTISV